MIEIAFHSLFKREFKKQIKTIPELSLTSTFKSEINFRKIFRQISFTDLKKRVYCCSEDTETKETK